MALIDITDGDRVRQCEEADLAAFVAKGFSPVVTVKASEEAPAQVAEPQPKRRRGK